MSKVLAYNYLIVDTTYPKPEWYNSDDPETVIKYLLNLLQFYKHSNGDQFVIYFKIAYRKLSDEIIDQMPDFIREWYEESYDNNRHSYSNLVFDKNGKDNKYFVFNYSILSKGEMRASLTYEECENLLKFIVPIDGIYYFMFSDYRKNRVI